MKYLYLLLPLVVLWMGSWLISMVPYTWYGFATFISVILLGMVSLYIAIYKVLGD